MYFVHYRGPTLKNHLQTILILKILYFILLNAKYLTVLINNYFVSQPCHGNNI